MTRSVPNVTDPGRIVAHRGASQVAPENTLAAFREAARQGAHWIEFDVSLIGDGTPVIHHDDVLGRCTDRAGPLGDLTAGDLAGVDAGGWKGAKFAGEPLPTLEATLDVIAELDLWANLELKPHDDPTGRQAEAVAAALATRPWAAERIIVSSFEHPELAAFRALAPAQPIALLWEEPPENWRAGLAALDAAALHLDWRHLSQSLLREARRHGIDVRVYTANQPKLMAPFREMGLTGIITDHPPLYLDDPDWGAWTQE